MSATRQIDQTIAVTGAAGFIGSHVTQILLRRGYRVRALARYGALGGIGHLAEVMEEGRRGIETWLHDGSLQVVHGDVLDPRCVRDFIRDCDQVFHLAALIGIPYSYQAPASYIQVNLQGTLNLLEACREECPERLILTSTSEVYGSARQVPIAEEHPLQAQSPYAASKIAADALAESYARSFGLPIVTLRPFNTYGPRQSARAVIPTILVQALSESCREIRLGNLDAVRDLNYVEDTAAGFLALAVAPLEKITGRVYNLGTGRGQSVREVAELALKLLGVGKPIVSEAGRMRPPDSEVDRLIADPRRLRRDSGWDGRVELPEGLARTAAWIKKNLHLYNPAAYRI